MDQVIYQRVGQIPPPIGAAGEQLPLPTVQTNAAVVNLVDAVTVCRRGDGVGFTGVQRATATAVGIPVGVQGNNHTVVPPSTGIAQVAGATPTQHIFLPTATNNTANGQIASKPPVPYITSGIWQAIDALQAVIGNPATIWGELKWQPGATDLAARTAFKAQLLSQMSFRSMAFMRRTSNYI